MSIKPSSRDTTSARFSILRGNPQRQHDRLGNLRPSTTRNLGYPRTQLIFFDGTNPFRFQIGHGRETIFGGQDDFPRQVPCVGAQRNHGDLRQSIKEFRWAQQKNRASFVRAFESEPSNFASNHSGNPSALSIGPCGPLCTQASQSLLCEVWDSSRSLAGKTKTSKRRPTQASGIDSVKRLVGC
jgi:hypothetical protein